MSYEKNIEIYKMKKDVITPLASNPKIQASCTEGDFIIIIDNDSSCEFITNKYFIDI